MPRMCGGMRSTFVACGLSSTDVVDTRGRARVVLSGLLFATVRCASCLDVNQCLYERLTSCRAVESQGQSVRPPSRTRAVVPHHRGCVTKMTRAQLPRCEGQVWAQKLYCLLSRSILPYSSCRPWFGAREYCRGWNALAAQQLGWLGVSIFVDRTPSLQRNTTTNRDRGQHDATWRSPGPQLPSRKGIEAASASGGAQT